MAERFYANCPLEVGPVVIQGPEAHHLAAVCRVRAGDQVYLFNGDGRQYRAQVDEVQRREVHLHVEAVEEPARTLGFRIEVAAPLPKGDRGHFLIEKLTELGVTGFTPLRSRRSVVHVADAKLERLERYVIEASKQCGRNELLQIQPLADWGEYCQRPNLPVCKRLAHFGGTASASPTAEGVAVAVGPEGGFTAEEVELACRAGWQMVDLGPRVLRVETAALIMAVRAGMASA